MSVRTQICQLAYWVLCWSTSAAMAKTFLLRGSIIKDIAGVGE
jgi:hypothetical protein